MSKAWGILRKINCKELIDFILVENKFQVKEFENENNSNKFKIAYF